MILSFQLYIVPTETFKKVFTLNVSAYINMIYFNVCVYIYIYSIFLLVNV